MYRVFLLLLSLVLHVLASRFNQLDGLRSIVVYEEPHASLLLSSNDNEGTNPPHQLDLRHIQNVTNLYDENVYLHGKLQLWHTGLEYNSEQIIVSSCDTYEVAGFNLTRKIEIINSYYPLAIILFDTLDSSCTFWPGRFSQTLVDIFLLSDEDATVLLQEFASHGKDIIYGTVVAEKPPAVEATENEILQPQEYHQQIIRRSSAANISDNSNASDPNISNKPFLFRNRQNKEEDIKNTKKWAILVGIMIIFALYVGFRKQIHLCCLKSRFCSCLPPGRVMEWRCFLNDRTLRNHLEPNNSNDSSDNESCPCQQEANARGILDGTEEVGPIKHKENCPNRQTIDHLRSTETDGPNQFSEKNDPITPPPKGEAGPSNWQTPRAGPSSRQPLSEPSSSCRPGPLRRPATLSSPSFARKPLPGPSPLRNSEASTSNDENESSSSPQTSNRAGTSNTIDVAPPVPKIYGDAANIISPIVSPKSLGLSEKSVATETSTESSIHAGETKCAVCSETATEDNKKDFSELLCGHSIHLKCMDDFVNKCKETCPICGKNARHMIDNVMLKRGLSMWEAELMRNPIVPGGQLPPELIEEDTEESEDEGEPLKRVASRYEGVAYVDSESESESDGDDERTGLTWKQKGKDKAID